MPADQIDAVDQAKYYRSCLILYRAGLATALLFSSPAEVLAQSAPTADEVVLSELSVTGTGPVGERADGPVIGYRATRSATATRTDTPVRDSPQSINIVPRAVLTDQQDLRLTDAVTNVSNVVLGSTIQGRSQNYLIRGFSTQVCSPPGWPANERMLARATSHSWPVDPENAPPRCANAHLGCTDSPALRIDQKLEIRGQVSDFARGRPKPSGNPTSMTEIKTHEGYPTG